MRNKTIEKVKEKRKKIIGKKGENEINIEEMKRILKNQKDRIKNKTIDDIQKIEGSKRILILSKKKEKKEKNNLKTIWKIKEKKKKKKKKKEFKEILDAKFKEQEELIQLKEKQEKLKELKKTENKKWKKKKYWKNVMKK